MIILFPQPSITQLLKRSLSQKAGQWFILQINPSQMAQNQNFGIMDEGYFVPRSEILSWVNDLLKLNLTKIEELGSGAVYCQILDVVHPGKVAMSKVNWRAKVDYEFLNNYKVLQNGFDKSGIKRYIEVERLSKAKYQDNLQFIQWLKRYYEVNCNDKSTPYNPEERRGGVKVDFTFAQKIVVPKNFNAGGQIIPKTRINSKEKRSQAASGQKDSVKRLASPQNIQKLKPSSQQKKQGAIQRKESNKELKKVHGLNALHHLPPNPHQKATKIQQKPQACEESISIRPNRGSIEQLQAYKKKVRDLQSKLEMIAEIAQTKDDAEIKMKLIEEVLSIGSKVSQFEPHQSITAKCILPKGAEVNVIQSNPVSEQISHNQLFTFQESKQVSEKPSKLQKSSENMENGSRIVRADEEQQVF